jgi:aspartyl-tRNA(Asn)/glutamyl-tRNA(Gln) amidotransferase subunit A
MSHNKGSGAPVDDSMGGRIASMRALDIEGTVVPGSLFGEAPPAVARSLPAEEWDIGGRGSLATSARAIRDGALTPAEVLRHSWAQFDSTESRVQAWSYVDRMTADQAASLRPETWRGPLDGIPVGVKDLIAVEGMPTGGGSRHRTNEGRAQKESNDAPAARMLRDAGAIIVGKTNTHEFAFGGTTPPTRNPWDLDRIPGGSSGGSAAAVAAGHVPLALGSDTAGSVRIPSSYCGTAGIVPTPGLISSAGVLTLAWSLDRVGLIADSVDDLAIASSALGIPVEAASGRGLEGVRIGIPAHALDAPIDPSIAESFESAIALIRDLGATVIEVPTPYREHVVTAGVVIMLAESYDYHRERFATHADLFGDDVRQLLSMAADVTAGDYVRAQRVRQAVRNELLAILSTVDVIVSPTMPCTAPTASAAATGSIPVDGTTVSIADAHLRFNISASLAALPCASQPLPPPIGELPRGLHWMSSPGRDDRMLRSMCEVGAGYDAR